MQYREPKLVLFSGSTESACGYAFTHGSSEQRMHRFKLGYDTGDKHGDMFGERM